MVNGHLKYQHMVGPILSKIGWADIDEAELGRQQAISQQLAEAEKREKNVANHEDEPNDEKPEEEERRK
jgi:F0F1-type ATP synthase membrane subunit b/b'